MSKPEKITIDDVEYVRADRAAANYSASPVKIVILQRGWVMVGRYSRDGETVSLDGTKTIRRWGTTKGLGQLRNGPLKDTVLDECGHVEFHVLAVVAEISCEESSWSL